MGMVYINVSKDDKFFKQLSYFSPPIFLLFFVRSGINCNFQSLVSGSSLGTTPLIVIGVLYFIVRIIGKYSGGFLGCLLAKKPKTTRNYFGLALIPAAGVAIGLAAIGARELGGEEGMALNTIILSSSYIFDFKLSIYSSIILLS